MGDIAIYPNIDYIAPFESFKSGNYDAMKFTGKYKGKRVGYIIDHLSKVNLPIDFEFMPDFELEETLPSEQSDMKKKLYTHQITTSMILHGMIKRIGKTKLLMLLKVIKVIIGTLTNKRNI